MSTFLKERDLAGLKVCSVRSSPSILSVQSERGASCNSKLSGQSPPGPAEHITQSAAQSSREHAARQPSAAWAGGGLRRANTGHRAERWPTPQTATSHLPWWVEPKASGGNLTVRDNYLHSYLQGATRGSPSTEMSVNVHHIYRDPLHFSQAARCRGQQHRQEPPSTTPTLLPRLPQLLLEPGKPGPQAGSLHCPHPGVHDAEQAWGTRPWACWCSVHNSRKRGRSLLTTETLNKGNWVPRTLTSQSPSPNLRVTWSRRSVPPTNSRTVLSAHLDKAPVHHHTRQHLGLGSSRLNVLQVLLSNLRTARRETHQQYRDRSLCLKLPCALSPATHKLLFWAALLPGGPCTTTLPA